MVAGTSSSHVPEPRRVRFGGGLGAVIGVSATIFIGAAFVGAILLWLHYGTAVFFEMIASGLAACF